MEPKKRNGCIIVVALILVACFAAVAISAVVGGWAVSRALEGEPIDLSSVHRETIQKSFEAGDTPVVEIRNFAGTIDIRAGEGGAIDVTAVKKTSRKSGLDRIQVDFRHSGSRLVIKTRETRDTPNARVELEVVAPAGTRLELHTGAGTVTVQDITGDMDIHTGAGVIDVRGAEGSVVASLGAGQILYRGAPSGNCRFQSGAGEIDLRLPAGTDVELDAGTALGRVSVDFAVDGRVRETQGLGSERIRGTIGNGSDGSIYVHTGVGEVNIGR
jgi:hypothetical protein